MLLFSCFKLNKEWKGRGFLFFVFVSLEQQCFFVPLVSSDLFFFFFFVMGKEKKKQLHWQLEHNAVY